MRIRITLPRLMPLAQGGMTVGTGINSKAIIQQEILERACIQGEGLYKGR